MSDEQHNKSDANKLLQMTPKEYEAWSVEVLTQLFLYDRDRFEELRKLIETTHEKLAKKYGE